MFLMLKMRIPILLYNPDKELPIDLLLDSKSQVLSILISIKKFHGLFSNEADQISFLNNDNIGNKLYKEKKYWPNDCNNP
jgi:hypothetical protein